MLRPLHGRERCHLADGGLLLRPVSLPAQGLVLASAERADLLVDFSDLAVGTTLTWWNTAPAPFGGTSVDPSAAGTPDLDVLLPYPEVLRFRVVAGSHARRPLPPMLATDSNVSPAAASSAPRCGPWRSSSRKPTTTILRCSPSVNWPLSTTRPATTQ